MVVWRDAVQPGIHWREIRKMIKPRPMQIVSIGFELRRSKLALDLAQSIDEGSVHSLAVITIPLSAIIAEGELRVIE